MIKIFFTGLLLCALADASGQESTALVPMPANIRYSEGRFLIDETTVIHASAESKRSAEIFADYLKKFYRLDLTVNTIVPGTRNTPLTDKSILLAYSRESLPASGYKLVANTSGCQITGDSAGIFYGLQTLMQLLPPEAGKSELSVRSVEITDAPRFGYRGMHLDVGRHLFTVEYIKKYIDFLAWHKLNYFHWHLTEDQGWRLQIDSYPKLTETGSCRKQTLVGRYGSDRYDGTPYCGYYSKADVREVLRYAADRHITVIPEIEMPGHSKAALSSYPFLGCTKGPYEAMETWGVSEDVLCAGNDSTFNFLEAVLTEVIDLFPSPYIHIGGDECPKQRWKKCPACQQRIKDLGLKDEHELQSYFIRRVEQFVNKKGRTIIGWDEILEGGLAPNAVVMSWRGESGGIAAAKQQHYVIMTPENPLYLNHAQSKLEDSITQGGYNPIENVYAYDPVPAVLDSSQAKFIMGAQGNMWTEYISNPAKLEYMLFPRISALAEALWTPKQKKNWNDFEARMPGLMKRYALWDVNHSTAFYDLQPSVIRLASGKPAWKLDTRLDNAEIWYVSDSGKTNEKRYRIPVEIQKPGLYGAYITERNKRKKARWIWQRFILSKSTGKKITLEKEPNKSYSLGGAFTLVDGIQNEAGMLRSAQFLGFNGKDFSATIDLGKRMTIKEVVLHAFEQTGSWIYRPSGVRLQISLDGNNYTTVKTAPVISGTKNLRYSFSLTTKTRFIKLTAANPGIIADGLPGAGHNAWIFFDEISVF